MNWRVRVDDITHDHLAAVQQVERRTAEIEAQAREAASRIGEQAAAATGAETPQEQAAREAREERDRLLRESVARSAAERGRPRQDGYVMPTDWTDEDEARAEGYGPPDSWLK
ncbi:hypothetical protein [Nocardia blacklockiae]|uniref:hypothetical protein n=1 Tax=Nocardia blacklockiae TaxID=480036 RepID=UPI0018954E77|nr:hypothetical protein [Nocardia blacklockiae]MBF6171342.1 hypothetical protein [Nocardia blacklockiae]